MLVIAGIKMMACAHASRFFFFLNTFSNLEDPNALHTLLARRGDYGSKFIAYDLQSSKGEKGGSFVKKPRANCGMGRKGRAASGRMQLYQCKAP